MSGNVFFEDDRIRAYKRSLQSNTAPWMVRLVLKTGFIKNEKQAEKTLIILAVLLVCVAFGFILWSQRDPEIKTINIKLKNFNI